MMSMVKSRLRYPISIYFMYMAAMISAMGLVGPFMIKFFEEWGGLSLLQIFFLEAWFSGWIFVFEIPTGIVGDVWGRKLSYVIGLSLLVVGPLVYTYEPNLFIFFFGEFLFALGISFISGSEEAMIRDILERAKLAQETSIVMTRFRIFHYIGMILAGLVTIAFGLERLPLDLMFKTAAPLMFIALVLVVIGVKDERGGKERNGKSILEEYKITFETSKDAFRDNRTLWAFAIFVNGLGLVGYFVTWFYQAYMDRIGIDEAYFPHFRIIFLLGQITMSSFLIWLKTRSWLATPERQVWITKGIVVLISTGVLVSIVLFNQIGLVVFMVVVGGLSINLGSIYSTEVNVCIPKDERATVHSFISMGRNASRTLINPIFGLAVFLNPRFGLLTLYAISRITEIFALPREADFVLTEKLSKLEDEQE